MTGAAWLGSLLLIVVSGLPFAGHRAFAGFPLFTRAVLAGTSGAVFVSFAMTIAVLAGIPWSPLWLVAAGAAIAVLLRFLLRPPFPEPTSRPPARRRTRIVFASAALSALAVAAALVATASAAATSPDLFFFWGPKAQQFALARGFDAAFMREEFHQHMHAYYPPLVTNLAAFASMAAGRMSWTGALLTFPLLLGGLAIGLPGALGRATGSARSAALSALTVGALGYLGIEANVAGNAEMPLLLFETLAVALLLSDAAGSGAIQWLAGVLLAGATATKVEGLPFVIAAAGLFLLFRPAASRPIGPAAARLLLPAAVSLSAWFGFGASRGIFFGYSGYGRFLDIYPDHLPAVLSAIGRALTDTGHALPWLVPFAGLFAALPLARRAILPIGTAAILTAFFVFTYLHRPENPSLWISWSAARIFSPVAMLIALAAAASTERPHTEPPSSD